MLSKIIRFSINHKLIIGLFTLALVAFGIFALTQISIGAVPDITNNQVQVITTSNNLSTEDMEKYITYPVELEMANLPGVLEIRSITRFGLSVVTIVFEESMGTYLPRQLVSEKLQTASEKIPKHFGTPEIAPITSGLGEIYHYTLEVKPEHKEKYSLMELRTIQDWIVKRQLSGIPGVVEVNTWGGHLKQYEVAIQTNRLNALNITIQDIYTALEKNNSLSGGSYIERENQAYFIRGEGLVKSLEDIENIVVKTNDGFPVLIRDVAKVQFGAAVRFGAITGNGEGEKVMGQILMLKDADSYKVINAIQERVDDISENLPEGVYINPFLDRSELLEKTTTTVAENLILGILIVIFVVVLLFGNLRSGIVVASVIPLSLLFTLSMMYLFNLDANLMSMGAIDFGIIIDGAVIIVEFVAFRIARSSASLNALPIKERQEERNKITEESASKMMNAAVFGQLIILIVFIPILSLGGVEGKMFRPMALTFSFALVGAMILCFTYVPMVASLFLRPNKTEKKRFSDKLMDSLYRIYDPIIRKALKVRRLVLGLALGILAVSAFIFTTLGSEFVPQLDEGDFVIQPVLKTGTSLSKTIEITTQLEQILLEFPEVNQVVSRIGAAEVPTDPMAMEESDVFITLKPKKEWTTAKTKNELAERFKEALDAIPGMDVEFTQPIEMRFNELITGVQADIAIKIFGEDLDFLARKAVEIRNLIDPIPGTDDIVVEKVVGLPEMKVDFNRSKIARYGLNTEDLNNIISMGFAGMPMGSVFEGERRFDIALRLDKESRRDISNLENLYVDTPSGMKVPLRELATISYSKGAAQISRDDTKRRVVVGINVRTRDLQGVVDDIQDVIGKKIHLPPGYSIEYGGQFENLQSAKNRLYIAVPVALLLIFIMLYFAFKSIKKALIIYSVIPLAAVGGVLLLWLRDMPFSISAGVGFIALFGIAVLNGIVLIDHFIELKSEGMEDPRERIITGTKDRLRAVILTASAAALGFLPMAVSTSAGAEVQRPLATVVIGGLVSATILTLVVLPVLYYIFETRNNKPRPRLKSNPRIVSMLLLIGLFSFGTVHSTFAQKYHSLEELQEMAAENNLSLSASALERDEAKALIGTAFSIDKTEFFYEYDQNNLATNDIPLSVFGVSQDISFPTIYFAQRKVNKKEYELYSNLYELRKYELEGQVAAVYYQYLYVKNKEEIYERLDSLYHNFSRGASRRFELGETNYLEKITARAKQRELQTELLKSKEDARQVLEKLSILVQSKDEIAPELMDLQRILTDSPGEKENPGLRFYQERRAFYRLKKNVEQQQLLPDLAFSYSVGSNSSLNENLHAYQVGIKLPLFFGSNSSKIKAAKIAENRAEQEVLDFQQQLDSHKKQLQKALSKYEESLRYYEEEGKELSEQILKTATISYQNGEIDFFQYIQSLDQVYDLELRRLEHLNNYNQTVIALTYLNL